MGRRNNQRNNSKCTTKNKEHPLQASSDAISDECSISENDAIESCSLNKHPLQFYLDELSEKRTKKDKAPEETHSISEQSLHIYLDALFEKRKASREKALLGLVDAFSRSLVLEFAENNYLTLQHGLMQLIVRGTSTEVTKASRALGLLVITTGHGDGAHEIMENSVPKLSQALSAHSDSLKRVSVIECLAIVTFVGATCDDETYKSLEIIWQFIHAKAGSNVAPGDDASISELAAAIFSWSFLLTTITRLKIHSSSWQESLSLLSNLMDKEDHDLRVAVGDAIALVYEIGGLKEFYYETRNHSDNQLTKQKEGFACRDGLKIQIQNLMGKQSLEAPKNITNSERQLFEDLSAFLETGDYLETSIKVSSKVDLLEVKSWSEHIQLKFLSHILGNGFTNHMQKNEFLHEVFNPKHDKRRLSRAREYTLDNCKDTDLCYLPQLKKDGDEHAQRLYKSPNSVLEKARTQVLRKERSVAQARNNGHYALSEQDF